MRVAVILFFIVVDSSLAIQLTNIHACTEDFCAVSLNYFPQIEITNFHIRVT